MEQKRSTRGMRKNTSAPSPLQELAPTKQRVLRARNNKKNTTSENDNADAQSQQPPTAHHHVTSPSQSPQPHESHSEPEQVAESRSTSPSDQQQSSQHSGRPNTRSTSPSRIPVINGKASSKPKTPKTEGKKRAGRPPKGSVKPKGPSTNQNIGNPKVQSGKRNYMEMADASDADGEGADDRRLSKHHKLSQSPIPPNQPILSTKRKFEPSTHQGEGSDTDDSDSPTLQRKRQRISESKIPSPAPARNLSSPRGSTFPKSPFSYSGAPLRASPSAHNPFAMVPAHQPFGSSPKFISPVRDNSESRRSPSTPYESTTLISNSTHLVGNESPSSSSPSTQLLAEHNTTTKIEHNTPLNGAARKRMSRNSFASPAKVIEQNEASLFSSPVQEEPRGIIQTVPQLFSSEPQARKQSSEERIPTSNKDITTTPPADLIDSDLEQDSSTSLVPFVTHVKERLPPKPTSKPQRQIPTLSRPATPYINHTQTDAYDFEDSIVLSDDEADIDMEESKRKGRAWKQDYHKVRALEKEAKLAREKLQRGEALGPEFNKKSPGAHEIRRKQGRQTSASRNSFLRAVHDHIVVSNNSNTLPDPEEVVAVLQNSNLKRSSETTALSYGQKAGIQHNNGGSASIVKNPSPFYDHEMDHLDEEQSAEEDEESNIDSSRAGSSREVTTVLAVPVTPFTPAPKSGGWFSSIKSGVQRALTPFTFKGTSRTTNTTETEASETPSASNGSRKSTNAIHRDAKASASKSDSQVTNKDEIDAKTEFTFAHEHNIADTQVTPTRPPRKVKSQSERRTRTQPSRSTFPQTERKRRRPQIKPSNEAPVTEEMRKFMALIADPEFKRQQNENALRMAQEFSEEIKAANAAKAAANQAAKASTDFASATSKARANSRATRAAEVEEEVHIRVYPNSFRAPDYSDESDEEEEEAVVPLPKQSPGRSYGLPDSFYDIDNEAEEEAEKEAEEIVEDVIEAEPSSIRAQVPPPTPKPANAQLPFQRYQPKKPSGLRNVTAMSPIQKEIENAATGDDWRRIQQAVDDAMGLKSQAIGKPVIVNTNEIEDERVRELCPEHVQEAVFRLFN